VTKPPKHPSYDFPVSIDVSQDWVVVHSGNVSVHTTLPFEEAIKLTELDFSSSQLIVRTLQSLPTMFGLIIETKDLILAAVDRFRSFPLFYTTDHKTFALSDDANTIALSTQEHRPNLNAIRDFLLSGHTVGDATFLSPVSAFRPGEYSLYNKQSMTLDIHRFADYSPYGTDQSCPKPSQHELASLHVKAVATLTGVASGKTLVVPLRGYYQDLLVLKLLAEANYPNLVAIDYSTRSTNRHFEHKRITKSLGVQMLCVCATRKEIKSAFAEQCRQDYARFACNYSSLPNYQSYMILTFLLARGKIPTDAIIVDGVPSPFCTAVPSAALVDFDRSRQMPEEFLWNLFFSLSPALSNTALACKGPTELKRMFRINSEEHDIAGAIDLWLFNEWLPKILVNERCVYQFLGLDHEFPFLSSEFVDYRQTLRTPQLAAEAYTTLFEQTLQSIRLSLERAHKFLTAPASEWLNLPNSAQRGLPIFWDRLSYFCPTNKGLAPYGYPYFLLNYRNVRHRRESAFAARHLLHELQILGYPQEHLPAISRQVPK
jgi:hypothetical protein